MMKATMATIWQKIEELWNTGNPRLIPELFTPDYIHYDPNYPEIHDLTSYKKWLMAIQSAFPDLQITIHDVIESGNKLVLRWTVRGTHLGEYHGLSASQQTIMFTGMSLYHLMDGKISRGWVNYDTVGMMRQLGALSVQAQSYERVIVCPSYN